MDSGNKARECWLNVTRRLVITLIQRRWMEEYQLCPEHSDPTREELERYSELQARIAVLAQEQRQVEEQAEMRLGVLALLDTEPALPVRLAVALLTGKALSGALSNRIDSVSELAEHAVPNSNPADILRIRQSFSRGGVLRPHCSFIMRRNLGSCQRVALTERAVGILLNLPAEQALEFDVYAERNWRD